MRRDNLKRVEAICKMAEHKTIYGLYITYGLQGLTHRTADPYKLNGTIISAGFYPYLTLERLDGSKLTQPICLGNWYLRPWVKPGLNFSRNLFVCFQGGNIC